MMKKQSKSIVVFMVNENSGNFEIELTSELFEQVNAIMEIRGRMGSFVSDERVPYNPDIKQKIDIVGESNFQDNLLKFKKGSESEVWENGVLIPEPDNPHDSNAILLYLITDEYWIEPVGYVPRELASRLNRPLSNLMVNGQILPVKCQIVGGTPDYPNLGVRAWIKSDAIDIENLPKSKTMKLNSFSVEGNAPTEKDKGIFGGIKTGCGCLFWGVVILVLLVSCV